MKSFDSFKPLGDVIWNIANILRGPYRPPQYRRVMIPLTVLRRLDCVLKPTKDKLIAMHKKLKAEGKYDAEAIEKIINQKRRRKAAAVLPAMAARLLASAPSVATAVVIRAATEASTAAPTLPPAAAHRFQTVAVNPIAGIRTTRPGAERSFPFPGKSGCELRNPFPDCEIRFPTAHTLASAPS
jgi:hypothetical protein